MRGNRSGFAIADKHALSHWLRPRGTYSLWRQRVLVVGRLGNGDMSST